MLTIREAHERCVDGDRIFRVIGQVKGYWYEDQVLDYVREYGFMNCAITDETDEIVTAMLK